MASVRITDLPRLPPRRADANKGDFGRVLVVAGSRTMSGAAILCACSALRSGAGLVRLAVPECIRAIVAGADPCYTLAPLPQDDEGRLSRHALNPLVSLLKASTVAAIGPGLGQSDDLREVLAGVLAQPTPLILDADALNVLAGSPQLLGSRAGPRVLTPHPGEFARLTGRSIADIQADREPMAERFAAEHGVVLVLKGQHTVVTDGRRTYVNNTGNPGMATGGTGDVLGGLIAALVGQKLEPFAAALLGVFLHGLAGDLARDSVGEVSLIAGDLLDYLPRAFQALPHVAAAD